MNKRFLIAIVLIIIVFVGYTFIKDKIFNGEQKTPGDEKTEKKTEQTITEDEDGKIAIEEEKEEIEKETGPVSEEEVEAPVSSEDSELEEKPEILYEQELVAKGDRANIKTSLYEMEIAGGKVTDVTWKKYPTDDDVPLFTTDDPDKLPLQLKFKSEILNKTIKSHPFKTNISEVQLPRDGKSKEIIFFSESEEGRIEKHLKFHDERYIIDVDIIVKGKKFQNELKKGFYITPGSFTNIKEKKWDIDDTKTLVMVGDDKKEDKLKDDTEEKKYEGLIEWCAMDSKYFLSALVPRETETGEVTVNREKKEHLEVTLFTDELNSFTYYLGPKEHSRLGNLGHNLTSAVHFGWSFLSPISLIFLKLLNFFHGLTGNYGLDILILSILLNLVLLPLSLKGYRSTRIMAQLQPKLKELQKKYKEDPQELNKRTMELYKEYGASPFGGCLPLLLQMPIFISLYWMLRSAVELKGASFVLWINDLSTQDALFKLPFTIPLIGTDNFNLLPILMMIMMFISQKVSGRIATDSPQSKFMVFMPLIFGFIFYTFPSGLVLYWLTNTILNTLQQKFLVKPVEIEPGGEKK